MELTKPVKHVMDTLENAGFEAWLVGGGVRDSLMGNTPKDYDITTNARPQQVMELFEHSHPTGIEHGTVTVVEDGEPVEVTTFRAEGKYSDHRHPDEVRFVDNIEDDLARRDFTVNAMAWNPKRGLVDPFGGQEDLKKGIIRAVGNPERRFEEDALRMLRAIRFAARYGFEIEENTLKALEDKADLTKSLAVERVVPEVESVLKDNPDYIEQMIPLLKPWIPELEQMAATEQNTHYHYTDVLHHTIDAIKASPSKDPSVLWALLLHDAGKPAVRQFYNGEDHFKKHELESYKIAKRVVKDLKLPAKMQKEIPQLVLHHDTFYGPKLANLHKLRVEKGWPDDLIEKLFDVQYGDIMAHASHDRLASMNAFKDFYEQNKNKVPLSLKDLPISGKDVMEQTNLKGKQVGQALDYIQKQMILHPELYNRKDGEKLLAQFARSPKGNKQ